MTIPVVSLDKVDGSTTTKDFPVLLPHKILKYLFEEAHVDIKESNIQKFWSHLRAVRYPWAMTVDSSIPFIPIGVHGDEAHYGADTANINKLTCLFLDLPLWRPKNARLSRFLMFCIDSAQVVGYESLHPVLQAIAESINLAYFGINENGEHTTHCSFHFVRTSWGPGMAQIRVATFELVEEAGMLFPVWCSYRSSGISKRTFVL